LPSEIAMTLTPVPAEARSTPRRLLLSGAAAALLAVGLAGCSGARDNTASVSRAALPTAPPHATAAPGTSGVTSPAAADVSSCGLVTAGEVSTATGKAMGQGAGAGTICSYSATADPSTVVYVQLYNDAPSMGPAKAIEAGSEHLAGLGDDAFWARGGTLFVQKGNRGFTISTPSLALTSSRAPTAIRTLATDALGRL
jgi:hypothetical protein